MICLFDLGASFWRNWYASRSGADAYTLTLDDIASYANRYPKLIVCCDTRSKRHDWFPEYKANRDEKPQEAIDALRAVEKQLKDTGTHTLKVDGYEADDLIATLAVQAAEPVHIISGDKDLYQLITPKVSLITKNGEARHADCVLKFGVPPDQLRDWLALVGDAADNVPGCPGCGPGRATSLLQKFGSIEKIQQATDEELLAVDGVGKKTLTGIREWQPEMAIKLVSLMFDAPVSLNNLFKQPLKVTTMKINIETGFKKDPLFLVVHGQEGVGKSTFAVAAPSPFVGDAEKKAAVLGVPRAQANDWDSFTSIVDYLLTEEHAYKTFIPDTIDAIELMLHSHICKLSNKQTIDDFGFGKGPRLAEDYWVKLIDNLDRLRFERGMHIIALAHSSVKTFHNPEGNDWDRWEMKLDRRAAALFRERSTACMFARFDVATKTDNGKTIGLSTGQRVMETVHSPAWDAKNTLGLPDQIPLSWSEFSGHVRKFYESKQPKIAAA